MYGHWFAGYKVAKTSKFTRVILLLVLSLATLLAALYELGTLNLPIRRLPLGF